MSRTYRRKNFEQEYSRDERLSARRFDFSFGSNSKVNGFYTKLICESNFFYTEEGVKYFLHKTWIEPTPQEEKRAKAWIHGERHMSMYTRDMLSNSASYKHKIKKFNRNKIKQELHKWASISDYEIDNYYVKSLSKWYDMYD